MPLCSGFLSQLFFSRGPRAVVEHSVDMVLIDEFTLQETSAPSYSQISSTLRTSCVGIEELKSVPSKNLPKYQHFARVARAMLSYAPPPHTLFEDGLPLARGQK